MIREETDASLEEANNDRGWNQSTAMAESHLHQAFDEYVTRLDEEFDYNLDPQTLKRIVTRMVNGWLQDIEYSSSDM
jgi:hypothetical protein